MRQASVRVEPLGPGGPQAAATLWVPWGQTRVTYEVAGAAVTANPDPFTAVALLPAMRLKSRLEVEGGVAPALLRNLHRIQVIHARWDRTLRPVPVLAGPRPSGARPRATAAFFSGGVDSFHTAISHAAELDALVFVHGFDIAPERQPLLARVAASVRQAASELRKPLVEVWTDVKAFSRSLFGWGVYHGSALASAALLLAPSFGRIYIPGSLSVDSHFPYGSHPLLDPLWSTEEIEIVYDGFGSNRLEKTAAVAGNEVAMRWLRVCNRRGNDEYNCGRCGKCLRTMVALDVLGALGRCSTLPSEIPYPLLRRIRPSGNRDLWRQTLQAAEALDADPELISTLRSVLARPPRAAPATTWSGGSRSSSRCFPQADVLR